MKKTFAMILTAAVVLGSSLTAFAAPERMPDGGVFDAEYYAQNNPDVEAVIGTDKDALYNHYLFCGRNEGRQPYEPGTEQSVPAFVPVENRTSGTTVAEAVIYGFTSTGALPRIYMLTDSRPIREHLQTASGYSEDRDIKYDAQGIPDSIFRYDAEGKLDTIDKDREFEFDEKGKLIQLGSMTYHYDKQGFLIKTTLFDSVDEYGYNEQNKIAWVTRKSDSEVYGKDEYTYDELGRLIKYEYHSDSYYYKSLGHLFNYDEQGRLIGLTYIKDGIPTGQTVTYMYE